MQEGTYKTNVASQMCGAIFVLCYFIHAATLIPSENFHEHFLPQFEGGNRLG